MKLNLYSIILICLLAIIACNNDNPLLKEKISFPLIKDNLPVEINVISLQSFSLISDFVYPKHSFILLSGEGKSIIQFLETIKLENCKKLESKNSTFLSLHEYMNSDLCLNIGESESEKDSVIFTKWGFTYRSEADYCGYFNSSTPNKIFIDEGDIWNGKVTATLKDTLCLIFVEELRSPTFQK